MAQGPSGEPDQQDGHDGAEGTRAEAGAEGTRAEAGAEGTRAEAGAEGTRAEAGAEGTHAAGGDDAAAVDDAERLLVDMVVAAPVDVVWAALREPGTIRRWFGWDDAGLDGEIRQIFLDEATADDDARTLTWADGDRFELEAGDDGAVTHVRLHRRGHVEAWWDGVHDLVDEGWIMFSQQLRFLLERHADEERRTVHADGVDLGPEDDALLDRLGLRSLGDDPVGSRYTVTRPDGSTFGGEVFFQTDLQIGLSVDEEDDALLVVARRPPASAPPHGTAVFLLSLFGGAATDEGRREAAEQRWRRWWGG